MRTLDEACAFLHDAYEEAALSSGWATQEASRTTWDEVPIANKATMRVAVAALLREVASEMIPEGAYNDHNRAEAEGDRIGQAYHESLHDAWSVVDSLTRNPEPLNTSKDADA